jgi:hypothetical protein
LASDATIIRNVKRTLKETREKADAARSEAGVNRSTGARHALKVESAGLDRIEEIVSRKR